MKQTRIAAMLTQAAADRRRVEAMLPVLIELRECAEYWSEYYVPLGIHERIDAAIAAEASAAELEQHKDG
jgi:hypothetical protein